MKVIIISENEKELIRTSKSFRANGFQEEDMLLIGTEDTESVIQTIRQEWGE